MVRKARGTLKQVKSHRMFGMANAGAATVPEFYGNSEDVWIPQDDIEIIGCSVTAEMDFPMTPAVTEGHGVTYVEVGRVGKLNQDGVIGIAYTMVHYITEIVVAQQIAALNGPHSNSQVTMFPSGYGWHVDQGEAIHLNIYALSTILASGDTNHYGHAQIFYVEA